MPSPAPFTRPVALAVFGPTLLFGIAEGAAMPVLALSARALGASVAQAALLVALIGVGSLVSNIPASVLTMRRGERWAIVAAAAWCALALALCAFTPHLGLLAAGAFMIGMAQSVFNLARQSWLTEATPPEWRARTMSTLGGVMRIGMFIGPFLGAAAILAAGLMGAYAVGLVALALAGVVAARLPDVPASHADAASAASAAQAPAPTVLSTVREHRRVFLTLGVGVVLVSAVRATRQVVIPLWADHLLLDAALASLIYGLAGGLEMLVFYPAGKIMDRHGRRAVAVPSMLILGAALVALPFTAGAGGLLAAALAMGFGNGIGSGLLMTIGADHSPPTGRAHFLGVWRLLSDVGASCGPALLSVLAAVLSLGAGIAVTGVIAFGAAGQLAYWIPRAGQKRQER